MWYKQLCVRGIVVGMCVLLVYCLSFIIVVFQMWYQQLCVRDMVVGMCVLLVGLFIFDNCCFPNVIQTALCKRYGCRNVCIVGGIVYLL